jgi:hypothetical protein
VNIFIVSSGRPTKQITAAQIFPDSKHLVMTVVPEREMNDYLEQQSTAGYIFHNKFGIKDTRQFILDYAERNHIQKFVMLDDDLTFYKRQEDGRFNKATPEQTEEMFDEIELKLYSFAHVGVCDKFMSHTQPREYITNGRYNQVMAYNLTNFPIPFPKFRVEVGEEQDFNLQLLSKRCESCILTEWSKSAQPYTGGGCSTWRTAEVELQAHKKVVELWPGICSLKDNKSTISKTSLSIQWKKAFNDV